MFWRFAVQFDRENCHHHRSDLRLGERGRPGPESEGGPGHPGLQVRESSPSCYFFLSLVISRELLEEDHRIIRLLESSNHASVINIWLLSYSVSNYRDVVKGHEVAGGIKSETQVIDVWTAELTVITQRAKWEILPGGAPGGTVRALLPQLRQAAGRPDAGDWDPGGHPDQLRGCALHSSLEDAGRVRVPAGGELPGPLPPHLAPPAPDEESRGRGQDHQRLLLWAQDSPGCLQTQQQQQHNVFFFQVRSGQFVHWTNKIQEKICLCEVFKLGRINSMIYLLIYLKRSKLCLNLFSVELARRLEATGRLEDKCKTERIKLCLGVSVYTANPGLTNTNLGRWA